jgi:hypothetical protein
MTARILAGLVGLLMAFLAFGWLTDPTSAAANLGMPLLDGIGRSTQVGDITAFFVVVAGLCIYGAWRQQTPWLIASALLLGSAAVFRTVAWLAHGADLATSAIVAELVMTALLVVSSILMSRASATDNAAQP